MSDTPDDDWLAAERERHGPVSDEDVERAEEMMADAHFAWWDSEL